MAEILTRPAVTGGDERIGGAVNDLMTQRLSIIAGKEKERKMSDELKGLRYLLKNLSVVDTTEKRISIEEAIERMFLAKIDDIAELEARVIKLQYELDGYKEVPVETKPITEDFYKGIYVDE